MMQNISGNIKQHLLDRHLTDFSNIHIDEENRVAVFFLYDLSGKMTGYQAYRPEGSKEKRNDEKGRYYTWTGGKKATALYGVSSLKVHQNLPVILVEGIFDAARLHTVGLPALAVLTNDPKFLRNQLSLLPQKTIAICEDGPGIKLAKYADRHIILDPTQGDIGDMSLEIFYKLQLEILLKEE